MLTAQGQGMKATDKVEEYVYHDDAGREYKVEKVGGEHLLTVDDSKEKTKGCCMMDESAMDRLLAIAKECSLLGASQNFRGAGDVEKAKKWYAWLTTDKSHTYHGYSDKTPVADKQAMHSCMERLERVNKMLREVLKAQQKAYGHQKIVCMTHSTRGFSYMMTDDAGNRINPCYEFSYFNYGNRVVVQNENNVSQPYTDRHEYSPAAADHVGGLVKVVKYKKPDMDMMVLDAPSSRYTFYLFDGKVLGYDTNYMSGYDGEWVVEGVSDAINYLNALKE